MLSAVSNPAGSYCAACWNAKYPVPPVDEMKKERHENRPVPLEKR
jgi:hypothetical protein